MSIDDACQIMNGVVADPKTARRRFRGVSIDTRSLAVRNAFFCLRGTRTDGHRFAAGAAEIGAGALVGERRRVGRWGPLGVPVIGVDDPLTALGDLAAEFRKHFPTRYIAVTGSVGKTTTKELIAAALSARFRVYKSPGNYNNLIGIPLALLARSIPRQPTDELGVLEFGMSTPGEIRRLTEIVDPAWGVVTRIGAAHLEQMKTVDAVARAKRELFDYSDPGLVAILNFDDIYQRRWDADWGRLTLTYAIDRAAEIVGDRVVTTQRGVQFRVNGRHQFSLRLAGEYNVSNALAAVTTGWALNVPFSAMAERMRRVKPVGERSRIVRLKGATLIDDCYNANPVSMLAALRSLLRWPAAGRRIAVFGVMHELGRDSDDWHHRVGRATKKLDIVMTVGDATRLYRRSLPAGVAHVACSTPAAAARHLRKILRSGDVVLVKASRAEGLETIAPTLKEGGLRPSRESGERGR